MSTSSMKVRFWGCRGSIPRARSDMARYGGNTPCVEITSSSGGILVLDLGSGAFDLGLDLMKRLNQSNQAESMKKKMMSGTILITHTHWDHIQGFPFFAPLFIPGFSWSIYGPKGLAASFEETLAGQMQHEYFPVSISHLGAHVDYHDLLEGSFEAEGILVKTHYLNHTVLTLGYRLEVAGVAVAYITDHEPYDHRLAVEGYQRTSIDSPKTDDDRHVEFFSGVDLLIHDCQYTAKEYGQGKTGWGHSTVEYVVDIAIAAEVKQLALFHHDPNRTDDQMDDLLCYAKERAKKVAREMGRVAIPEIFAAAEGMAVDIYEGNTESKNTQEMGTFGDCLYAKSSILTPPGRNIEGETVVVGLDCSSAFDTSLMEDLKKDFLKVEFCKSFASLIQVSERERPSVLVMNQYFPGDGGSALEICEKIRHMGEWGKNVSFLIVAKNQNDMEQGRVNSTIVAANDWITEPTSVAYIRTRIRMSILRSLCRWKEAPLPKNETERLAALNDSCLLEMNNPESLSRIGRIAKQLFDVSIVSFALIDEHKVKFIAVEGLPSLSEISRNDAFCSHVINTDDVLVVNDALQDDRFASSPLVDGAPYIRFYCGAPISVKSRDGKSFAVGAICLMDRCPKRFHMNQINAFKDLSAIVNAEFNALSLELRNQNEKGLKWSVA